MLAGGVKTEFVVEGDRVVASKDAGSTIPDSDVRDCVVLRLRGHRVSEGDPGDGGLSDLVVA